METTPLTIAVSGRTNSGKTTLIRTLLKSAVGEVADAPNVTKTREVFYFEGIQARFVDTPGFQNASMLSMFYAMSEVNSNFSMPSELDSKIKFDKKAVQALRNADVVLYVASLSSVPDESFVEELSVIRRQCKRIVAVINQYHRQRDASTELLVNSRVAQWQAFCEANQIHNAVVFDAHWDNPRKVNELYDAILTILDPSGRDRFTVGLNKFKERQVNIRDEACKFLAKMIRKCNEFEIKMQKRESENSKIVDEARKAIAKQVEEHFVGFVFCVSKLYKIAADHPTSTLDQLKVNIESKIDHLQRISLAGGVATITSGIFAIALGAAVGVASGGAGALVGMQLGATLGGVLGAFSGLMDDFDKTVIRLSHSQLDNLLVKGIGIIWGLSFCGYGRGRELTREEIEAAESRVKELVSEDSGVNYETENEGQIIRRCSAILSRLEACE